MSRWPIPDSWAWVQVQDFAEVVGGGTPTASDASNFADDGTPWLTPADLSGFDGTYISRGARSLSGRGLAASSARMLPTGSVLFSSRAPIGYTVVAANPIATNQGFKSLVLPQGVVPEYVRYYLLASRDYAESLASGSTFKELSGARMKELLVPLPPTAEQRRIVAKLDELLAGSRASRAALDDIPALLEQHRQAVLASAFNGALTADWREEHPEMAEPWRELPWRDVGRCQNGRAFPSGEYAATGVRLLRPGNLHVSGRVEWTPANTRCMPPEWAARFPAHVVGPGEIVMNLTAQSLKDEFLGRVCMTGPDERCLLNQRIARLTPTALDARYAFWLFKSPRFRRYVDQLNTGSLIQHMFTSQVDDFVLPVPPRSEQGEIARRIDELMARRERLAQLVVDAGQRSSILEAAILARAFSGHLVPQDPSDEPAATVLARAREGRTTPGRAPRRPAASRT